MSVYETAAARRSKLFVAMVSQRLPVNASRERMVLARVIVGFSQAGERVSRRVRPTQRRASAV